MSNRFADRAAAPIISLDVSILTATEGQPAASSEEWSMADSTHPPDAPRRPAKEYEDPHFHDEDEVVPPPDDDQPSGGHRPAARPFRKLPPPKRRFDDD